MTALRIVIADDSREVCDLLVDQLTSLGHVVVARAPSGRAAVERTLAERPDVVLLDVHMPDGSGVDAASEIARRAPQTGVILFTGDEEYALPDSALGETSAVAFLPKPASRSVLDAAVRLAAARARELWSARDEAETARRQLENRKLIERAKGILMRRTGSSEQEAYRILQRTSQDRAVPMVQIAQAVLDSEPGAAPVRTTPSAGAASVERAV